VIFCNFRSNTILSLVLLEKGFWASIVIDFSRKSNKIFIQAFVKFKLPCIHFYIISSRFEKYCSSDWILIAAKYVIKLIHNIYNMQSFFLFFYCYLEEFSLTMNCLFSDSSMVIVGFLLDRAFMSAKYKLCELRINRNFIPLLATINRIVIFIVFFI